MILNLVKNNDSVLHRSTEKFNFDDPQCDPTELFHNLRETMVAERGLGLAANQCGIGLAVFVFGNPDDESSILPVFNPLLLESYGKPVYFDEGCLSYKGLILKVKRASQIRVRFYNEKGVAATMRLNGLSAHVFAHEFDHTAGLTFINRANRYHLEQARKHMRK